MDAKNLVDELMAYLNTPAGKENHAGPNHELCSLVDDLLPALVAHPAVRSAVGPLLLEGDPSMATHILTHLIFDLARLYERKQAGRAAEEIPPISLDENVWTSGWDSGGDL